MKLSILTEASNRYFKWMHQKDASIHRIPGFAFTNRNDALKYADEFDGWCVGDYSKQLYTFTGVAPTDFPILFGSVLSYSPKRVMPDKLSHTELQSALKYFAALPEDFFINGRGHGEPKARGATADEIKLFMAIANTVGCLKPKPATNYGCVYDVEVFYGWPAIMTSMPSHNAGGRGDQPM
jgi:hypothetical protein